MAGYLTGIRHGEVGQYWGGGLVHQGKLIGFSCLIHVMRGCANAYTEIEAKV